MDNTYFVWGIQAVEENKLEENEEEILNSLRTAVHRATERFSIEAYTRRKRLDDEEDDGFYDVVEPTELHFSPNLLITMNFIRQALQNNFPSLNIDTDPDNQLTPHHIAFSH